LLDCTARYNMLKLTGMKSERLIAATLAFGLTLPVVGCAEREKPNKAPAATASVSSDKRAPHTAFVDGQTPSVVPSAERRVPTPAMTGFAIGDSLFGLPEQTVNDRLDKVRKLGNAIRLDFDWSRIQPNEGGSYQWRESDAIVAAAKKRGLTVLGMVGYAPAWARDSACAGEFGCAPRNSQEFAIFAGAVAEHYRNDVTSYEIGNEPNIKKFFGPKPDAARYARMFNLARAAIRNVTPNAKIATAGLSPAENDGTNIAPTTFLNRMYDAGITGFDAIAIHPYSYPARPAQAYGWSAFTQIEGTPNQNIQSVHDIMATHGDGKKEVWLTEYGAPTNGAGAVATKNNQHIEDFDKSEGSYVDEDLQAQMLDEYLRHKFIGANVTVRMVYNLYDRKKYGVSTDREDYFGIYHADGSPKKAVTIFPS
jgi:polysaccharide biosynthesis protein PslG